MSDAQTLNPLTLNHISSLLISQNFWGENNNHPGQKQADRYDPGLEVSTSPWHGPFGVKTFWRESMSCSLNPYKEVT